MDDDRDTQVAAVAALAEPSRRRLYDHVVRQPAPVSRDEAAAAVDLPRATVANHLDPLVAEDPVGERHLLERDGQVRILSKTFSSQAAPVLHDLFRLSLDA